MLCGAAGAEVEGRGDGERGGERGRGDDREAVELPLHEGGRPLGLAEERGAWRGQGVAHGRLWQHRPSG